MQGIVETCRGSERCVNKVFVFPKNQRSVGNLQGSQHLVVFFLGDDVGSTSLGSHPDVRRMSDPSYIAETLSNIFPETSCVAIIVPSRYEGGYACYDHFIEFDSWDLTGMHIKGRGSCQNGRWVYTSRKLKAIHHLYGILLNSSSMNRMVQGPMSWKLVGFSKGGIVLNQILTEISNLAFKSQYPDQVDNAVVDFCRSLSEVHYLDVGLPCPGAYIWDDNVIKGLANFFSPTGRYVSICIHGTSRQFGIRNDHVRYLVEEMLYMIRHSVDYGIPIKVNMYNVDDTMIQLLQSQSRGEISFYTYPHEEEDTKNATAEHCRVLEYMYLTNKSIDLKRVDFKDGLSQMMNSLSS